MQSKYTSGRVMWTVLIIIGLGAILAFIFAQPQTTPDIQGDTLAQVDTPEVSGAVSASGDYTINPSESTINWAGYNKIVASRSHKGGITPTSGNIVFVDGVLAGGHIVADTNSIVEYKNGEAIRSSNFISHLLSEDFFEAEVYPNISFVFERFDHDKSVIIGNLTMRGLTREIEVPINIALTEDTVTLTGEFSFDRTQWGIVYGSDRFFDELGNNVIDDRVDISFNLVGALQ